MSAAITAIAGSVPVRHRVAARRKIASGVVLTLLMLGTLLAVALLVTILGYVIFRGLPALNIDFFTQRPLPFGEVGGGAAPALIGTLILAAVSGAIAIPIGIAAAIFVVEYQSGRFAAPVRFAAELIAGLPSIVIGVFVWAFLVRGVVGHYAAIAGGVALAVIMIPIVARTVEEVLRLVPHSLREAALALGAPKWKVILAIVLPTARAGVITASVLALARSAGETAPLLLTALGNDFFSTDLLRPIGALPLQIYRYAISPYDDWHTKAWGASLVLVLVIGAIGLLLRVVARQRVR
ncbi:MAG TPA: phosphate ABC transporter permease PstA [Candidatus Limnocylindria bacterium]|nr:phosphate ABC transporter permease PstA [Candidatus Limnocylindria bacterium]